MLRYVESLINKPSENLYNNIYDFVCCSCLQLINTSLALKTIAKDNSTLTIVLAIPKELHSTENSYRLLGCFKDMLPKRTKFLFVDSLHATLTNITHSINHEYIAIVGIDSLNIPNTIAKLNSENRLLNNNCQSGIIPGEAAVCTVLKKTSTKNSDFYFETANFKPCILISNVNHERQAIYNHIEYKQKHKLLQTPEINIQQQYGNIGCAALPMQIKIAVELLNKSNCKVQIEDYIFQNQKH